MSELEKLREEYDAAVKRRHGKIGATGLEIRADALRAALEAENERLRCCGNCGHNGGTKCCEPRLAGATGDLILTGTGRLSCRFTPSRWKEAER